MLALIMSVFMIMTVFVAVPVSATTLPANIGTDYVPGERVGNAFGTTLGASYNYNHASLKLAGESSAKGDVWFGATDGGYSIVSYRVLPDPNASFVLNNATGYHEWDGVSYHYGQPFSGGSLTKNWGDYTGQKADVVFSFKVKGIAGKEFPIINAARSNNAMASTNGARIEYPVEYNSKTSGFVPDSTSEWQTFSGTFANTGVQPASNYGYTIGFAQGTPNNAGALISSSDAYLGIEYMYDINVSSDKDRIMAGESFTVDADVVNQVGGKSSYDQTVTWYAVNEARTETAEGFTITPGSDGTATISTTGAVAEGVYYLVAVANANADFVKGVAIEVGNPDYSDYVPGEITGNILTDPIKLSYNYHHINMILPGETAKTSDITFAEGTDYYTIKANRDIPHPLASFVTDASTGNATWDGVTYNYSYPFAGGYMTIDTWGANAEAKGNLVYSFKVNCNTDESGIPYTPTVNVGRTNKNLANSNSARVEYPMEYSQVTDGVIPESTGTTEWTSVMSGTFADKGVGVDNYSYQIGLAKDTEKNATAYISRHNAYMGLEYIYDIVMDADKTVFEGKDSKINIEYGIVNQIYRKGGLSQDVDFIVTTTDRVPVANSGIEITDNGDGTAVVTYDPFTTVPGDYDIVVYSEENEMAKGVTITVPEVDLLTSLELSEFDGNKVTAEFMIMNKGEISVNAIMVIVMVNDKNKIQDIVTERITNVNSASGLKTYTKTLTATDLSKITKAKVFVFDCGESTAPSMFNTNMKELAESITKIK